MQNFKQKKDVFDQQIQHLEIGADQSDKFFASIANMQIIEKRKIEELSTLIASLEYLYIRKNTFKDSVDQLKLALAKDVQQSKSKIEFYNQLKSYSKLVSKKNNNTLKFKHEIHKYMDREYHYLKKQQELEGRRKIEVERELTPNKTLKTKDALIRTELKLRNANQKTDKSLLEFYDKFKEAENHKYSVVDPVVVALSNFTKNYFEQMNRNFYNVNFGPITNNVSNVRDINNSEVINNYKLNQQIPKDYHSSNLQSDLLQSNHSNKQDDIRESNLNQTIYMKNEQNSPKKTSFNTNTRNVIQQYDPPMIHNQQSYQQNMPTELDYNRPDPSGNQIPYMLKNPQETAIPINDLVTPYMNNQLNEDRAKWLFGNNDSKALQNSTQQQNKNYNQSFGQFSQQQNQSQRQEQVEPFKQSQSGSNFYPFQSIKQESQYQQQENVPSLFSFREHQIHPQRYTQVEQTNDNFFNI